MRTEASGRGEACRFARLSLSAAQSSPRYYAYSTINDPAKGEVGGSSPPRPTIQILCLRPLIPKKYAARVLKSTPGQGAAPRGILGASQLQESRLV